MKYGRIAVAGALLLVLGMEGLAAQGKSHVFGLAGGATIATLGGSDVDGAESRVGLAFGGFASFGLSRNLSFETGAMYSMRGAKDTESGVEYTVKLDYIELPLLLSARFPGQSRVVPFLSAGPALAFKVKCGITASGGGTTIGTGCDDLESELGIRIRGTDAGLVGAAGIDVNMFRFAVRYYYGLSSVDDTSPNGADIKNRVVTFLVGYGFRLQ